MKEKGSVVHPWYKGIHEWQVEGVSKPPQLIEYTDAVQGNVRYAPVILSLRSLPNERALWFTYWISTDKTKGRLKWGGGSPMLEESVLLDLLKGAIQQGFFTEDFLRQLDSELKLASRRLT